MLLYGTSESNLNKLQRVLNDLARVVLRAPWRCHTAPLLLELHWLPIHFRIKYKVALMTYKVRHKGTKLSLFLTARLYSYSCVEIQRSTSSGKPEIVHCQGLASFQTLGSFCLEQLVSEHSLRNLTR